MPFGAAPGTEDTGIGWAEEVDGRCSLRHSKMKRSIVDTQNELCSFQEGGQLTYGGVGDQEWSWSYLLCDPLQHCALLSAACEDNMRWRGE